MTEVEKAVAELWKDKCPECGCPAYIGLNQVTCVSAAAVCRNGSEAEKDKYVEVLTKIIRELTDKVPAGMGSLPMEDGIGFPIVDFDDEDTDPQIRLISDWTKLP